MRILLAEDDAMIGSVLVDGLKDAAYAVDWVKAGPACIDALASQHYDLLLLDLGLPGKDGMVVLRSLRQSKNSIPVLVITARDGVDARIDGLDAGADDYLVKPVEMRELLARMRAIARRKGGSAVPLLSNGIVTLDPSTQQACVEGAAAQTLSKREFSLLQALLLRPGAILSRGDLEDRMYGWNEEVESNAVEFIIHALRKKLGSSIIKNVRGAGWMVAKN
jgi:two-component system OmpR family response regulator